MTELSQPSPEDTSAAWLDAWVVQGRYDTEHGVYLGPSKEEASFPAEGIELFADLDEDSFWFAHRSRVILHELERAAGANAQVLEVGSGSGAVAAAISSVGHEVMAIEPTKGGAVRARLRGVPHCFEGTLHEAELPSDTFDCVGLFDVIEHLDDWAEVLLEAKRVLRPSGHLLLTVPAYQWLWSEHDDWNEHKRRYSLRGLRADLASTGFEITRAGPFFAPLMPPAIVRNLMYRLGRREKEDHEERLRGQLQPSQVVNNALSHVLAVERRVMNTVRLPFGTSLFALATPSTESRV